MRDRRGQAMRDRRNGGDAGQMEAMRDRRNNHRMDVEGSPRSQTKCSLTIPCGEHSSIRRMILLGRVAELWETRTGLAKDTTSVAPVIGAAKVES
jgi:hypothetical protein